MSSDGSVKDLVVSRVSGGDVWGSFSGGELDALGAPHPLWGAWTLVLVGFLKGEWSMVGGAKVTGQNHSPDQT